MGRDDVVAQNDFIAMLRQECGLSVVDASQLVSDLVPLAAAHETLLGLEALYGLSPIQKIAFEVIEGKVKMLVAGVPHVEGVTFNYDLPAGSIALRLDTGAFNTEAGDGGWLVPVSDSALDGLSETFWMSYQAEGLEMDEAINGANAIIDTDVQVRCEFGELVEVSVNGVLMSFGGVPAIRAFAVEHPEVSMDVINKMLAMNGGYLSVDLRGGCVDVAGSDQPVQVYESRNCRSGEVITGYSEASVWELGAAIVDKQYARVETLFACESILNSDGNNVLRFGNRIEGAKDWSGMVVFETPGHVVQHTGKGTYVAHDRDEIARSGVYRKTDVGSVGNAIAGVSLRVSQRDGHIVHVQRNEAREHSMSLS